VRGSRRRITFRELRELFARRAHHSTRLARRTSIRRTAGGALFPISRGMLQAADIDEDLVTGEVVAADGRDGVRRGDPRVRGGDLDVRNCSRRSAATAASWGRA
jgi:hypothetical protein